MLLAKDQKKFKRITKTKTRAIVLKKNKKQRRKNHVIILTARYGIRNSARSFGGKTILLSQTE